ncbi:prepilin peptidase [Candidatus Peregrinibacteria bacterium]|jgi:leader peptidase (prepilin peptidase) / N-methyltransferase|nr:prepilin peptidase [Candidatus Peregrinibacteria bacterium]MBT7736590.1 prepilin peptidase [Candidatus Peregrinibacteria bacterium]
MTTITAVFAFILGSAIGSFISVVVHRLKKKKQSIVFSRSICPACKKKLKFHHLFPVFSWLSLKGKCAFCGKKISPHYLALEVATGLLFVALFLNFNFIEAAVSTVIPTIVNYTINWETFAIFLFYVIESALLMTIFFYDLKYKEIPDRLSIPAIAIAIAGGLVFETVAPLSMLIGGIALGGFFLIQFVLSKGKWVGGGDIRLGALMGIFLGWKFGLFALIAAYIIGSLISIALLIQKKVSRKTAIPFGPFLVTGVYVAIFFGEIIINWYTNLLTF